MLYSVTDLSQLTLLALIQSCSDILLHRLEPSFGILGRALQWFISYIHIRPQMIVIHVEHSRSVYFHFPFGVHQGSELGPLLNILLY